MRNRPDSSGKSASVQAFEKPPDDFGTAEDRQWASGAGDSEGGLQREQRLCFLAHAFCVANIAKCGRQPVVEHGAVGAPRNGFTQETLSLRQVAERKMGDAQPANG